MNEAIDADVPVYISPVSAWEVGLLVARGRLPLSMEPVSWFERALSIRGMELAQLSAAMLIRSSFLPGSPPRDPMDRILIATARDGGFRLVTRDKHLLAYANDGHMMALAC
jgi:PIN domain nuclease of toxin-antitoxin system